MSQEVEPSVGPDNIEGYDKVQALAAYLVSLRDGSVSLTDTQATEIIRLWNNLHEYDKRPTTFSPRHRTELVKGRFKVPKRRTTCVIPGLESTMRCFLGSNAGPAQWPDCNRYVEAVISRLCDLNPSPERSKGSTKTRWTLVCRAYKEIRERIINNGKVITETRIQMPEVNQATVSQWFIRREKKRDKETLQQGIPPPPQEAVAEQPLPEAVPLPSKLPQVAFPFPFTFVLPENTAGTATLRACPTVRQPYLIPLQPKPIVPRSAVFIQPQVRVSAPFTVPQTITVPSNSSQKRSKKHQDEGNKMSSYQKKCSYCGKPREPLNHRQYYGNWYCKNTMTEDYDTWKKHHQNSRKRKKE